MNKAYNPITWANKPATTSPINATNLNAISQGLSTVDDRVIVLDSDKVTKEAGKGLSTEDYTTTEKNKLAGISANAKNVAISDTLPSGDTIATITIDGTATDIKSAQVTVDSALSTTSENPVQNKVITAELNGIEGAMEESMSGNPIIAECANLPAKELSVALEPIQDLHGYDYPWVGGAGKNLLPLTLSRIKALNTAGTWSDNAYTHRGITFTVLTDDADNVIGIKATGTSTNAVSLYLANSLQNNLTSGTQYYISGCTTGSNTTYGIRIVNPSTYGAYWSYSSEFSFSYATGLNNCDIYVYSGATLPTGGAFFYPMIRLASITDSTFAPYTNICPISGRTGTTVTTRNEDSTESNTATLSFGQTVYGGTVDFKTGKVRVEWKLVDFSDNSLSWTYDSQNARFYTNVSDLIVLAGDYTSGLYCSCYEVSSSPITGGAVDNTIARYSPNAGIRRLYVKDTDYTDATAFKTARTGQTICYELATPTELTLTSQQLTLLKGYNYISADGVMDITFVAKNLPSTPTTDGTYKLIVTVANGVPTFSWVAN